MAGNTGGLALFVLLATWRIFLKSATVGATARQISVAVIKNPIYMFCALEVGNSGQAVLQQVRVFFGEKTVGSISGVHGTVSPV